MRRQTCLLVSHAAAVRQQRIRIEKTMGMIKAYLQDTAVTAAKHPASAQAVPRIAVNV